MVMTMTNVIAFLYKAMEEGLSLNNYEVYCVQVERDFSFSVRKNVTSDEYKCYIYTQHEGFTSIPVSEEEFHRWEVLLDDVRRYQREVAEREFQTYFNKNGKVKDINDLNDEED